MSSNASADKAEHLNSRKYRADIDGLRAVAVLSVVGFHAFPNTLKGGFIGVDIFFVISGFLISTIIFSNLDRNTFSFVEFYSRRIKRIFPALLIVLIACFAFGWFTLLSDQYKQLGRHIAGGAGFLSNFLLWQESGYFDSAADTKPLLHLWSLGIEEQFYFAWPLLLWLAWKQRLNFLALTSVVLLISFVLNINKIQLDSVAAFYSPQTRFWELSVGSLLAYLNLYKPTLFLPFRQRLYGWLSSIVSAEQADIVRNTLRSVQSLLGITLIAIGMMVITKESAFPGWWALLPTVGALLIISAGLDARPNRVVLANPVLVWFGLISYPLYLWHWPILSFARILGSDEPAGSIRVAAIIIAIVLAWLTYKFIERPLRFGNYSKEKTIALVASMLLIGIAGYYSYTHKGLAFRLQGDARQEYSNYFDNSFPEQQYLKNQGIYEKYRTECSFIDPRISHPEDPATVPVEELSHDCFKRDTKYEKSLFIWGDSHAQQLYYGLKERLPATWQILQVASFGCLPDITIKEPSKTDFCKQSNWFALKTINEEKPDVVIVAQDRGHSVSNFNRLVEKLSSLGVKKIILIGPAPNWTTDLPKIILTKLWENTPRRTQIGINQLVIEDNARLKKQFSATDSAVFISLIDFFCNQDGCLTYLGDDKKTGIVSWDSGHLTPIASDYLAKHLLVDAIVSNNNQQ